MQMFKYKTYEGVQGGGYNHAAGLVRITWRIAQGTLSSQKIMSSSLGNFRIAADQASKSLQSHLSMTSYLCFSYPLGR